MAPGTSRPVDTRLIRMVLLLWAWAHRPSYAAVVGSSGVIIRQGNRTPVTFTVVPVGIEAGHVPPLQRMEGMGDFKNTCRKPA